MMSHSICHNGLFVCKYLKLPYKILRFGVKNTVVKNYTESTIKEYYTKIGGFGAMQEVCGAFSAATAVISYYISSNTMDGKSKGRTYQAIRRAAEIFANEYGSIRCKEILHGNTPKAFQCEMKVKDAVLVVRRVLAEEAEREKQEEEKIG